MRSTSKDHDEAIAGHQASWPGFLGEKGVHGKRIEPAVFPKPANRVVAFPVKVNPKGAVLGRPCPDAFPTKFPAAAAPVEHICGHQTTVFRHCAAFPLSVFALSPFSWKD
jgi:hypothetical protein